MFRPLSITAASICMCALGSSLASANPFVRPSAHFDPIPIHRASGVGLTPAQLRQTRAVWQPLKNRAPLNASTALLMTDGSVLVQSEMSPTYYRLTPDKTASYIDGTWSQAASLPTGYGPLYYASAVLPDARVIVEGGEYNVNGSSETNLGAIYDPVADKWTSVAPPAGWNTIGDAPGTVLANGTFLMGRSYPSPQTVLFDEKTLTWTTTGSGKADPDSEEGFTLLPSGDVLAIDVLNAPAKQTELYDPSTGTWHVAASTANDLVDHSAFEIGAQVQLPSGMVFVEGGSGNTGVYNDASGTWSTGPTFPVVNGRQLYVDDGPAALLQDGNVLCVASQSNYGPNSQFFEYNGKSLLPVAGVPNAARDSSFYFRMLELPNGQILLTDGSSDVEVYTHVGKAHPALAPIVSQVSNILQRGSTYPLTGVHLNGFSQGAAYGDDAQMATNYPLVRIINKATGVVQYARTHDFSSMAIASPSTVSTMVDIPATLATGPSSLVVVANGVPSAPVSVTIK